MLQMLEIIGCVQPKTIKTNSSNKSSLFSKRNSFSEGIVCLRFNFNSVKEVIYKPGVVAGTRSSIAKDVDTCFEPTLDCVVKMGQFEMQFQK